MDGFANGYPAGFYADQRSGSLRSARAILPIVFEAVQPQSVVDVGCGVGTWLRPARALGAQRTVGIEGDWVLPPSPASGIELHHASAVGRRRIQEALLYAIVRPQRGIQKEPADLRQYLRERIKRLQSIGAGLSLRGR